MAPRGPPRAQDGLQDGPRYFKMAQDSLRHASKRPQDGPKTVSSALRALQGPPKDAKIIQKPIENQCLLYFSLFRFRWALEASRWPQDGPREPQEGPKRAPIRPQERPRALQERPKRAPRRSVRASEGTIRIYAALFFQPWPPRRPQEASQTPKKSPKRAPRPPKRAPTGPQKGPKSTPREPQDGSKLP